MVYKRRRLLCSTTTDDARVYQAPPGDGRSKQLAPSGDDVTPSGQVVKWSTYDVPSSHGHGKGQGQIYIGKGQYIGQGQK